VARRLGRHYVGLERDPTYAAIARKRIAEIEPLELQDVTNSQQAHRAAHCVRRADRSGAVAAGTVLSDMSGRLHARVARDGTLSSSNAMGEHRGSITRWVRRCRVRRPATAGPSGTSKARAAAPDRSSAPAGARGL